VANAAPETQTPSETETAQEPLDGGTRYWTNGELRTWKRCPRKWWLTSYRRVGPAREAAVGAAALGTRVHEALAAWYVVDPAARLDPVGVVRAGVERDRARLDGEGVPDAYLRKFEKEARLAQVMVEGYLEWLEETGADAGLAVVAPETRLTAPLPGRPGHRLLAKLDLRLVREEDGARLFLDHKTKSDFTRQAAMVQQDEQMYHYHLVELLAALEEVEDPTDAVHCDGAIYNMLRKVARTARATPPFYKRVEIRHSREELRRYLRHVFAAVAAIERASAALDAGADHHDVVWPNPTQDCTWDCEFHAVCPMFDDGSRVEEFVAAHFVEVNPLRRYEPKEEGDTS
jgi:hypothetical protein